MDKKEWKQAKKAYKKAKHRAIRPWKGMSIFSAIFAVVFIAVFVICSTFDNTLAAFNGGTFWKLENEDADAQYFTSDFDKVEDNVAYGTDLCQRVEAEGAALLMNENDALPLKEGAKVSTFSNSSVNIVYGGTGSGNIDASSADTWKDALESAGFSVNKKLWDFYESGDGAEYASDRGGTVTTAGATTSEVPWKVYTDDVKKSVEKYGDAALVMISRVGGEGADATYDKSNYLALDDNEKDMLSNLAQMKKEADLTDTDTLMRYIRVLSELSGQLRYATQKRVLVELAMIKLCRPAMEQNYDSILQRIRVLEQQMEKGIPMMAAVESGAAQSREETESRSQEKLPREALSTDVRMFVDRFQELRRKMGGMQSQQLKDAALRELPDGTGVQIILARELPVDEQELADSVEKMIERELKVRMKVQIHTPHTDPRPQDPVTDLSGFIDMDIDIEP